MDKKKIAFFDFCETLVNFQTADTFIDYIRIKSNNKKMWTKEKIHVFLRKLKVVQFLTYITKGKFSINKRLKLFQLSGFTSEEINNYAKCYYEERIKDNFIPVIIEKMILLQKNGWDIVLVSGGYDSYLNIFAREYHIDTVFSSRIKYKDNICTGSMSGYDCIGYNKVKILNSHYNEKNIISKSFSDSISDVPFLLWSDEGYVISKKRHQEWVDQYNLNEIIW